MNSAFVIPCKFDPNRPAVFDAISSIKLHCPKSEVYIVDSNSQDKSYLQICRELGAVTPDWHNENYVSGATWLAYKNTNHEFYYTIHDSCRVLENLEDLESREAVTLRYFRSWHGVGWSPNRSESSDNGHINQEQFEWAESCMIDSKISAIQGEKFNAVLGSILFAKRETLKRLEELGLSKILPSTKDQDQTLERVMGIALKRIGIDAKEVSLQGYCYDYGYRPEYRVRKEFLGRV